MSLQPTTAVRLYDGALVKLRNDDIVTIRPNKDGMRGVFPWISEGSVPRRSWTDKGKFVEGDDKEHPLDIVLNVKPDPIKQIENVLVGTAGAAIKAGMTVMKNDDGLLVPAARLTNEPVPPTPHQFEYIEIPYRRDLLRHKYMWRFRSAAIHQFKMIFTELDGELFDSQRNWVFDAETGRCKVCPSEVMPKTGLQAYDITSMIMRVPLVEHDAGGFPWTPPERRSDFRRIAELRASYGMTPLYAPSVTEAVTETGREILSHFSNTELGQTLLPDGEKINQDQVKSGVPLFGDYEATKTLLKLMSQMAKRLGGELSGYEWISTSEVECTVYFEQRLVLQPEPEPVRYSKTFRISVSGCDNNAHLPMKKVT